MTGAYNASASCGRIQLSAYAFPAAYPNNSGFANAGGNWYDTITIQPENPALLGTGGMAVFTYYLNGSASSSDFQRAQFSVYTECVCGGPSTYGSTPINSTFTVARGFTFGAPFQIQMHLDTWEKGSLAADMEVSLTAGGYTVTDGGNNPAAYTAASTMGVARSRVLTNGDSYAGFTLTNTVANQTAAALLAGAASSSNEIVTAQFTASHGFFGIVSDVLDLSGTGTNLFVLQMNYNKDSALAQFGDPFKLALQYLDPATQVWTNAIYGNSDHGTNSHFSGSAFNIGLLVRSFWGIDTNQHTAWAVLDHNSRFAVGGAYAPTLHFTGITSKTNGVSILLLGPASGQFFIDQSMDLTSTNWSALGRAIPDANGAGTFLDSTTPGVPQRFYRARQ